MQYFLQIQKLFNFSYVYIRLDGYCIDFKSRLANSRSYTLCLLIEHNTGNYGMLISPESGWEASLSACWSLEALPSQTPLTAQVLWRAFVHRHKNNLHKVNSSDSPRTELKN